MSDDKIERCEPPVSPLRSGPKDDGGPAFPAEGGSDSGLHAHPGMSLRDWFAGQALSGIVIENSEGGSHLYSIEQVAKDAYCIADAMLAERAKGAKP